MCIDNVKTTTSSAESIYEHYVKQSNQSTSNQFPQLVEMPSRTLTKPLPEKVKQQKPYKAMGIYSLF